MRAVARLRATGIPILRTHADRAKEIMSRKLSDWLATQGTQETKSTPQNHAANGRAEVGVSRARFKLQALAACCASGVQAVLEAHHDLARLSS